MSFPKSSQQLSTNNTASALNNEMHSPSLTEIFQESFERSVFQGVSSTPPTWNQSRVPRSISRQDLRSIIDEALAIIDDVEDLADGTFSGRRSFIFQDKARDPLLRLFYFSVPFPWIFFYAQFEQTF